MCAHVLNVIFLQAVLDELTEVQCWIDSKLKDLQPQAQSHETEVRQRNRLCSTILVIRNIYLLFYFRSHFGRNSNSPCSYDVTNL